MKNRVVLLVVVVLLGVGTWAGYSVLIKDVGAVDGLLVSGNIEAHESVVSFKAVQSRVVELPFDEGQWVKAGTLLARLDDSDYRQQVAINEAALRVQEQQLASAMQKLEAAHATIANDNADLAQKNIDYGRSQKLWSDKIISGDQRDHTETALKQSSAAMQRDLAMERSALQDIEVAKANIRNATENLKLANIMLGYTTLRAPFSGVILTRQTELGEVMQPGTPVVTLADLDHVWLRAYVAETHLLFCDTPSRLKSRLQGSVISIVSSEPRRVRDELTAADGVSSVVLVGDAVHLFVDDAERRIPDLGARLRGRQIPFDEIVRATPTIEDLFVEAVRKDSTQAAA